jgi:hypothetical protein
MLQLQIIMIYLGSVLQIEKVNLVILLSPCSALDLLSVGILSVRSSAATSISHGDLELY